MPLNFRQQPDKEEHGICYLNILETTERLIHLPKGGE